MYVYTNTGQPVATAVTLSGDNVVRALVTTTNKVERARRRSRRFIALFAMAASMLLYALAGDASAANIGKADCLRNGGSTAFSLMLSSGTKADDSSDTLTT